jgi:hypothetical protein
MLAVDIGLHSLLNLAFKIYMTILKLKLQPVAKITH